MQARWKKSGAKGKDADRKGAQKEKRRRVERGRRRQKRDAAKVSSKWQTVAMIFLS